MCQTAYICLIEFI